MAYYDARLANRIRVIKDLQAERFLPLRVIKELNGRAVNVSPSGASARESAFYQSYRAQLAHFIAVPMMPPIAIPA